MHDVSLDLRLMIVDPGFPLEAAACEKSECKHNECTQCTCCYFRDGCICQEGKRISSQGSARRPAGMNEPQVRCNAVQAIGIHGCHRGKQHNEQGDSHPHEDPSASALGGDRSFIQKVGTCL